MKCDKALQCLVGGWGFLNATISNTTTGEIIPEWHSPYPSGGAVWTSSGHLSFIVTSNDTTEADVRPKELSLPAKPTDPDSRWALVGQHSLAVLATTQFTEITSCGGEGEKRINGRDWGHGRGGKGQQGKPDFYKSKGNKGDEDCDGNGKKGPSGTLVNDVISATLPSWVGLKLVNNFEFYDDCNVQVQRSQVAPDLVQTVWFYRRPQVNVFA
ncbi:hypothetical protein CkaCkLH20_03700 [Colletotrichum karsti]|uniref:Lipocalin-like domain-containing protein n=1 Tax=Colletotrichum karsti TaxID=1095194 RepID=A0A9P6IH42_9PEZI|nr:uncharacterized protein CkaCkLH20_03700 [Colletotrichum karsti]KAF9878800.1 hypothetical protein CkaCkLH20_03700 [Colletotrichum karsti]